MLQEKRRVSWQRGINQNHCARLPRIKADITILFRTLLLLLALTLSINIFLPLYTYLGDPEKACLCLVEALLPGMHLRTDKTFPDIYNMLLEDGLAGFSGTVTKEILRDDSPKAPEVPERLIAVNPSFQARPHPMVTEEPPVSLLVAPTAVSTGSNIPRFNDAPRVLIYHTHTTESFLPLSGQPYSNNLEQSVVFLGELLAQILERDYGIPVLHNREIFDISHRDAYNRARPVIAAILEEYPQIEVVVDLHRDGVSREITTFSLNNKDIARIFFIVGTRNPEWNNNYRFSLYLQNILDEKYPGLCRGARRQIATYNQHLHPRSVLVEIGSHENTKDEALRAIPYLAEALAGAFD